MDKKDLFREHFFSYISDRIREERIKSGITQDAFAEMLDISRASIINIEKGRHNVNLFMVYEIAYILNVNVIDLLPPIEMFRNNYADSKQFATYNVADLKQHDGSEYNENFDTIDKFLKSISTTINKTDETGNTQS